MPAMLSRRNVRLLDCFAPRFRFGFDESGGFGRRSAGGVQIKCKPNLVMLSK